MIYLTHWRMGGQCWENGQDEATWSVKMGSIKGAKEDSYEPLLEHWTQAPIGYFLS